VVLKAMFNLIIGILNGGATILMVWTFLFAYSYEETWKLILIAGMGLVNLLFAISNIRGFILEQKAKKALQGGSQ
jgi:hypothetical protein